MSEQTRNVRKANGVDSSIKSANIRRLKRIEGQVRGILKMVEEDRYCVDIMNQIASVQQALRAVGREQLRNHLKHCVSNAIRKDGQEAEKAYDELINLLYKNAR